MSEDAQDNGNSELVAELAAAFDQQAPRAAPPRLIERKQVFTDEANCRFLDIFLDARTGVVARFKGSAVVHVISNAERVPHHEIAFDVDIPAGMRINGGDYSTLLDLYDARAAQIVPQAEVEAQAEVDAAVAASAPRVFSPIVVPGRLPPPPGAALRRWPRRG